MTVAEKTVIHWFRKGLRIHDNPALVEAVDEVNKTECVLRPIFILDPNVPKHMRIGANRWRFLAQSLRQLDTNLKRIDSRLFVVRGTPESVFPELFKTWNVTVLTFETDIEPYSVKRDERIENIAKEHDIRVVRKVSHTIFDLKSVTTKNGGNPPLTYQKFLSITEKLLKPRIPLDEPKKLSESAKPKPDEEETKHPTVYDCPSLEELGLKDCELHPCKFIGGENEALKRLELYISKKQWICKFEKPNTSPNSLEPSTTVLSPYLKFGCLSATLFYHKINNVIKNSTHTKPPVSLIGQLMWREYFYTAAAATPNFDKMVGNRLCYQIPWKDNEQHLLAWKEGRTGYPFIDAIMRQLKYEGWIHHLARHAVACFLTRGDLWISWERGMEVFEEYLLDADWALNAGNWLWLSASAFFHQYFRVYSPVTFGKKTDKSGIYIKRYVPELSKFPSEFIYEPWLAPLSMQKAFGCIIGKDYPERIVIHEEVYKENISKMSLAYKNNKSSLNKSPTKRPHNS